MNMGDALPITVLFTCHKCGLQRVQVIVRARGEGEDIRSWMDVVAEKCGQRHAFLSPACLERKADIAIPAPIREGDGIGVSGQSLPEKFSDDFLKSRGAN